MKTHGRRILACALTAAILSTSITTSAFGARLNELQTAPQKGMADTLTDFSRLLSVRRALFVGAHPDDESNTLLAYLNMKLGADTTYMTLNWGEGGENSIGSEFYESLGVLRSQELKSARMFDGATQMYGGAIDFGYSVSLKESLLGDQETNADGIYSIDILGYNMAKVIRKTRPQVMFTNHKAPNTDHGQHRATGWLAEYAIDLAADPDYVIHENSDGTGAALAPWQVQKLFVAPYTEKQAAPYADEITCVGANSKADPTKPDMTLDLGEYSAAYGMSYAEIGMIARNMHKCQKMISTPAKGETLGSYVLKKAAPGADTSGDFSSSVFGGTGIIDDLADNGDVQALKSLLGASADTLISSLKTAQKEFSANQESPTAAGQIALAAALKEVAALEKQATTADTAEYLSRIREHINQAATSWLGIAMDIIADDADVIPGQTVQITATAWARGAADPEKVLPSRDAQVITVPEGWKVSRTDVSDQKSNGVVAGRRYVYNVTVPATWTEYTGPYNAPYNEAYTNPNYPFGGIKEGASRNIVVTDSQDPAKNTAQMVEMQAKEADLLLGITTNNTDPYSHAPVVGSFIASVGGQGIPVQAEPALRVVPKLSVLVQNNASMLKYTGSEIKSTIEVVVQNNAKGATGQISLNGAPADATSGITVSGKTLTLASEGQSQTVTLDVNVPASYNDKNTQIIITASSAGQNYAEGFQPVEYSHIETQNFYSKAQQNLTVAQYQLPTDDIRIGFVKGGSDDFVFDYISGMYSDAAKANANLKALSANDITKSGADLRKSFDTIIIGKTALADQSPISKTLRSAQQNLLDFANAGGNLVLHYQNYKTEVGGKTDIMPFAPTPFVLGEGFGNNPNINKEDCEVYVSDAAASTPFYQGANPIDLKLNADQTQAPGGKLSSADVWNGWYQQRCEWTPGAPIDGQVKLMEDLGYTVLFSGQDPEGFPRPAILYKEMENGGHYTYSAVVWDRQLQNLTPGAYKLYANLISMGTPAS